MRQEVIYTRHDTDELEGTLIIVGKDQNHGSYSFKKQSKIKKFDEITTTFPSFFIPSKAMFPKVLRFLKIKTYDGTALGLCKNNCRLQSAKCNSKIVNKSMYKDECVAAFQVELPLTTKGTM